MSTEPKSQTVKIVNFLFSRVGILDIFMYPYPSEIEYTMREFYQSLSEKDRRRYAGIEALKFGFGGQNYIARALCCSRNTVRKGAMEVSGLSSLEIREQIGKSPTEKLRIRQPGGGRRPYWVRHPKIDEQFLSVLQDHTAGIR